MKIDDVISALELDAETAAILRAKVKQESADRLAAKKEYDDINSQKAALEAELVGDGKKGARNYKKWYEENFGKIQELQTKYTKFVERYGEIDAANPNPANPNPPAPPNPSGLTMAQFQEQMAQYTGTWSNLVKGIATISTKHMRNGRKTDIDVDAIAQLASEKFGGDINRAYEEWDRPEAEKASKAAEEKRINDEVEKRLKARQTDSFFPSTEQVSTGVSPLSKDRGDGAPKYDRSKVLESALTGIYEPATVH
ncbi:MAG: hypothetical protein KGL39_34470 [Patescibacteria group bacterium]|nr:hypothetical protein [Patescibacteria group bacterium]